MWGEHIGERSRRYHGATLLSSSFRSAIALATHRTTSQHNTRWPFCPYHDQWQGYPADELFLLLQRLGVSKSVSFFGFAVIQRSRWSNAHRSSLPPDHYFSRHPWQQESMKNGRRLRRVQVYGGKNYALFGFFAVSDANVASTTTGLHKPPI